MKIIVITLGGKAFDVRQLTIKADAAWREKAKPVIEPVAELAIAAGHVKPTPDQLTRLAFTSSLFVNPQATLDLVLAYDPALEAQREWIEENAYSEEALQALLALFFGMSPLTKNGSATRPAETT